MPEVIDASNAFRSGTLSIDQARCLQRICGSYSFPPEWARLLMPLDDKYVDKSVEAFCSDEVRTFKQKWYDSSVSAMVANVIARDHVFSASFKAFHDSLPVEFKSNTLPKVFQPLADRSNFDAMIDKMGDTQLKQQVSFLGAVHDLGKLADDLKQARGGDDGHVPELSMATDWVMQNVLSSHKKLRLEMARPSFRMCFHATEETGAHVQHFDNVYDSEKLAEVAFAAVEGEVHLWVEAWKVWLQDLAATICKSLPEGWTASKVSLMDDASKDVRDSLLHNEEYSVVVWCGVVWFGVVWCGVV